MTTITIVPESPGSANSAYRAIAGSKETTGKTAGEALDALTGQLDDPAALTLVVLQRFQPDAFFTAAEQQRLALLMARWRAARDAGGKLPAEEQAELETLVQAETRAAAARAASMADSLHP